MQTRFLPREPSTVGLVAHYKLWAGLTTAGKVFDYSLSGNAGTVTTAVPTYPGFLFVTGSQIDCGSDSSIDNIFDSGGTFAGWLRPTGVGQGNEGRVFDKAEVRIYCDNSATKLTFELATDTTDGKWTFPFDVTGDIWQHVVLVYDSDTAGAGGGPTVYVNGVPVVVTEVAAPDDTRKTDAAFAMRLGKSSDPGGSWHGKIGDIMFFNIEKNGPAAKSIYELTKWRHHG